MKTQAHVVSHGPNCLDGVAAAVAVTRYQQGRADVVPHFAGNNEVDAVLRTIAPDHGRDAELWITDISWRESETDAHLRDLAAAGVRIYWIDHHRTALERFAAGHVNVPFAGRVLSDAYEELLGLDAGLSYTPRMAAARRRVEAEIARSFAVADASRTERRVGDVTLVTAVCDG